MSVQQLEVGNLADAQHPRAGKIKLAAAAVTYDGQKLKAYRPPPYLGEHTEEVLKEAGYSPEQIEELRKNGAVA